MTKYSTIAGSAQNYLDSLEAQFNTAKNSYSVAKATSERAEKDYQRALAWETLVKGYMDALDKTDRLSDSITALLDKTKTQTTSVADIAQKGYQAFQWLLDDTIKLARKVEDYKKEVDDLLNDLKKAKSDPLYAGLEKLAKALDDAFICIKDALKLLLEALKASQVIYVQLGTDGMGDLLADMSTDFATDTTKPNPSPKPRYDYSGSGSCFAGTKKCAAPPKPGFPLKDKDAYWVDTSAEYKDIAACLEALRKSKESATQTRDAAKARMDSLEAALKAAGAASACKTK